MSETVAKRGRGRPRLHPLPDTSVPEIQSLSGSGALRRWAIASTVS